MDSAGVADLGRASTTDDVATDAATVPSAMPREMLSAEGAAPLTCGDLVGV